MVVAQRRWPALAGVVKYLHCRSRVCVASLVFLTTVTCGFLSGQLGGVKSTFGISLAPTAAVAATAELASEMANSTHVCPRCEDLFSRSEITRNPAKRGQDVRIQLRGEPKSGTGMMSSWAVGALVRTCELFQEAFGEESCRVEPFDAHMAGPKAEAGANHEWKMVFEPQLSSGEEKCSCNTTVGRIRITYLNRGKHALPVDISCPWSHVNGIPSYSEGCRTLASGKPVENYDDLRSCMQETPCQITDRNLQFATFRDPRAVAVSTYYWIETHAENVAVYAKERVNLNRTLDESILEILESVCLWTSTRYIVFNDLDRAKSAVFSYEEAEKDVLEWHYRWTHLAGLNVPVAWVQDMAALAVGGKWASLTQGVNPHPGGEEAATPTSRTWRDEVSPDLWDDIDAVVRRWLPHELVERLNMPCAGDTASFDLLH